MIKFEIQDLKASLSFKQIKKLIKMKILPDNCLDDIILSKKQFDENLKNIYEIGIKLKTCFDTEVKDLCNEEQAYEKKLLQTKFNRVYSKDINFKNELFYNLNRFDYLNRNIFSTEETKQKNCLKYRECIIDELDKFYDRYLKECSW